MAGIKSYSTTAASNTNAATGVNFDENQLPSTVNDSARKLMADTRSWYEDVEWRDWGHTVTRTGNTTFTISTDVTSIYVANRPIRCTDSSTLYGYIASSSYSAPNTTVTVTLDSGNLSASLTAVSLGVIPSTKSIPLLAVRYDGQIPFPATQNPSTDANTLDDYEEGTWTPVVNFGGATTGITYTTQLGTYTKIGRVVIAHINIVLSSKGSATGNATITGVPFTSSSTMRATCSFNWANMTSSLVDGKLILSESTTSISVGGSTSASTSSQALLTQADFSNTSTLQATLIFHV